MTRLVACVALLAAACDSSKAPENKFAVPAVTASPGMPQFKVVKDDVSTDKEKVNLQIALAGQVERENIDALLKDLYRQVMTRVGYEPSSVEIYIYASEERAQAAPDAFAASL